MPAKPAPSKAKAKRPVVVPSRGRRLWLDLAELVEGERGLVMLEEACRITDRLDRLDALLSGEVETWARIITRGGRLELAVDHALGEARQQASVLRQLLTSLPMKGTDGGDDDEADWLDGMPS